MTSGRLENEDGTQGTGAEEGEQGVVVPREEGNLTIEDTCLDLRSTDSWGTPVRDTTRVGDY